MDNPINWTAVSAIGTCLAVVVALAAPYLIAFHKRRTHGPIVRRVLYHDLMNTVGRLHSAAEFLRNPSRTPRERVRLGAKRIQDAQRRFGAHVLEHLDLLDAESRDACAELVGRLFNIDVTVDPTWGDDLSTIEFADEWGKTVESVIVVAVEARVRVGRALGIDAAG